MTLRRLKVLATRIAEHPTGFSADTQALARGFLTLWEDNETLRATRPPPPTTDRYKRRLARDMLTKFPSLATAKGLRRDARLLAEALAETLGVAGEVEK